MILYANRGHTSLLAFTTLAYVIIKTNAFSLLRHVFLRSNSLHTPSNEPTLKSVTYHKKHIKRHAEYMINFLTGLRDVEV